MRGRATCYKHGGVSTTLGTAHPHYTNGRYSKLLPARLANRYHEARANPALLSLRDDLAACESRLGDLFQRVDSGESGVLWQTLHHTVEALMVAVATKDVTATNQHLSTMRQLVTQGHDDYAAWREIQSLWDTRCKLTLTEQKTLVAMQQMVSTEQLMVYMGILTDAIQRIVPAHADPTTSRAILGELSTELYKISNREDGQRT